jgi:hypothetical protein
MDGNNLATVITAGVSGLVEILKATHSAANPGAAPLTEAQALEQLQAAVAASLAKDQALRSSAPASASQLGNPTGSTGE